MSAPVDPGRPGPALIVPTPRGELRAVEGVDPEYPSIDLFWNGRLIGSVELSREEDPEQPERARAPRFLLWGTDYEEPDVYPITPGYGYGEGENV